MIIRKPYDAHQRQQVIFDVEDDPSLTKQEMAKACDINVLMARYQKTGQPISHINASKSNYGDYSNVDDYLGALMKVQAAQSSFAELPAEVRDLCRNDPGMFLQFMDDPDQLDARVLYGLVEEPEGYRDPEQRAKDAEDAARETPTPPPVTGGE